MAKRATPKPRRLHAARMTPRAGPGRPAPLRATQVQALLAESIRLLDRLDRPDLALDAVRPILAQYPGNAAALVVAGLCANRLGDMEAAASFFERATELMPADPTPRRLKANLLTQSGRAAEAVAELQAAVALFPADADSRAALGAAYLEADQPDLAAAAYRAAAELDPADTGSRKNLILLDMAAGQLDEAAASYRALLDIDGQDSAGHLVATGRFVSVADWCADADAPYTVVAQACPDAIYPPAYAGEARPEPVAVTRPETYVAQISDATVVGGESFVIAPDGQFVWDIAVRPDSWRFDLTERVTRYADGGVALIDAVAASEEPIEAAIDLAGVSSFNYYHWLVEFVSRMANIEAVESELHLAGMPLLVDRAVTDVPQLMAALRTLVGSEREVIALEAGVARRVRRLILPSQLSWMPNNLRDGEELAMTDYYVSAEAIRYLRRRLAPASVSLGRPGHRRIFLARAGGKRHLNGADLGPVLTEFGIESVRPESLSFEEQIRLFADAELVVAETGAALTNLLFCPPGAGVVVMVGARSWNAAWYSQFAGVLGQTMCFVTGTPASAHVKVYQSGFTIDPEDLRAALGAWTSARSQG
jgi:capsular polysaccharide biosynthesis protein/Flp pilus assembly protein TadD